MRKTVILVTALLVATGAAVSYAQNKPEQPAVAVQATEHTGCCGGKSDKGMMGPPAMYRPAPSNIVATSDGGVVVLVGNKIVKYDKNLNLVREVIVEAAVQLMPQGMGMMKKSSCGSCANKMSPAGNQNMKAPAAQAEQKAGKAAQ